MCYLQTNKPANQPAIQPTTQPTNGPSRGLIELPEIAQLDLDSDQSIVIEFHLSKPCILISESKFLQN